MKIRFGLCERDIINIVLSQRNKVGTLNKLNTRRLTMIKLRHQEVKPNMADFKAIPRPQLHDTGLLLERHPILLFRGGFSTYKYDNITELNKN